MVAAGWAVLKVSVKAIWTTAILLPTLWLGSIPGTPQRRAIDVAWQFFRHGIEVFIYIVFVSLTGLTVESMVSRPLPAEPGGTNPFERVLMMGAVSVAALMLLRHIGADLSAGAHGARPVPSGRQCGAGDGDARGGRGSGVGGGFRGTESGSAVRSRWGRRAAVGAARRGSRRRARGARDTAGGF